MNSTLKICAALSALALSAMLPASADSFLDRAEGVLREEARSFHEDATSSDRWREWALRRANGEDANVQEWLSSRWEEAPVRLADGFAGSLADWAGAGLRESEWVETLDFGFQLPLEGRPGHLNVNAVGPLARGLWGGDGVLGWQVPLAVGSAEDGNTELSGNVGLFYRQVLGDSGLAGLNVFGDYQDEGSDGSFWRWSLGAEYRTAWADVYANRYFPSAVSHRRLLFGGEAERIVYSAGGYDAEVRFHAPGSGWLEGFAEYSLWEGEHGDGDEEGFRYGFRVSPRTGGAADGFHLEADYDADAGEFGGRFAYSWTLGDVRRFGGLSAFDPRAHFFAPATRRHDQNIRVRVRRVSGVDRVIARGAASVSVDDEEGLAEFSAPRYRAALAGGYEGAVLTLSAADERVSLSYSGGLEDGSPFSLVSLSSGDYALSLGTAVSGPDIAVLKPVFVFQRAGFPSATAAADIQVTILGPYSHAAEIQRSAASVAHRLVVPGFADAEFEVEGSEGGGGFYRVSSNGMISLISSLTAGVSHATTVRGKHAGFLGDALFTLAISVSSCDADVMKETADDVATLNRKLLQAAENGSLGAVCDLLQQGADVEARDSRRGRRGHTPLHLAAGNGHLHVVKYLLSRGDVDVNERSDNNVDNNVTPLRVAAERNHLNVVKYLLSRDDVDVNARIMGNHSIRALVTPTALHEAAAYGYLAIVKELLSRDDIDVNARNLITQNGREIEGYTPLSAIIEFYHFVRRDHQDVVGALKHLLSRDDIDATLTDRDGQTPLHYAVSRGYYDAVKYLLLKTPVNTRSRYGSAPLDYAVSTNSDSPQLPAIIATLRALGGICLRRTEEDCGLVMRPFHSNVIVVENRHDATVALAVTATTDVASPPAYQLVYSSANSGELSVDSAAGELTANRGVLTAGRLITVSIQAAAGSQSVTVERVISVAAAPPLAGGLSDYPSRLTAAAAYAGVLATLSATEEGARVSYRSGLDEGLFTLSSLPSGKAALSLVSPLGGEDVTVTAVVELDKRGYAPATVTAVVMIEALLPAQTFVTVFSNGADIDIRLSAMHGGTRYEKVGGSDALSVSDAGEISATAPLLSTFFNRYHLEARADSPGILGGERFSVSLLAASCAPGALPTAEEAGNLLDAVDRGIEVDGICRLILAGADVNARNPNNGTPLHRAVLHNYHAAASLLIEAGADVDAQNNKGKTPLHLAAPSKRVEMAALLASGGANVGAADINGDTPLYLAVGQYLFGLKRSINRKTTEIIAILLGAGADPTVANNANATPFALPLEYSDYRLFAMLAAHAEALPLGDHAAGEGLLREAARAGGSEEAEDALVAASVLASLGVNINARGGSRGRGALHIAAFRQDGAMVSLLLDLGADAALAGSNGDTPLHLAAENRGGAAMAVVSQLLAAGASATAANASGRTPFSAPLIAADYGMIALLAGRAEALPLGDHAAGEAALRSAAVAGDSAGALVAASLLASLGVNVDAPDSGGKAALHLAVEAGDGAMVSALVSAGANVSLSNAAGATPLHRAVRGTGGAALAIVSQLLAAGANATIANHFGRTPFELPLERNDYAMIALLAEHAEALPLGDHAAGEEALRSAAVAGGDAPGALSAVSLLASLGVNVDAPNSRGETALHLAVEAGDAAMVSALVSAGANAHAENNAGQTPLDSARAGGDAEIINLLAG